jgi:hypothetical protein
MEANCSAIATNRLLSLVLLPKILQPMSIILSMRSLIPLKAVRPSPAPVALSIEVWRLEDLMLVKLLKLIP